MSGSSELPDQKKMAPDCIAVRFKSNKFGTGDWLLPTTNRPQKAFSNSSLVLNEVVLIDGSSTTPTALPIHDTDVSYAHEVEQCIPQIAYFGTSVTNVEPNFLELRARELRRTPLLGTWMNVAVGTRARWSNSGT